MIHTTCRTYEALIYISGPIEIAKQLLRRECLQKGLCVTIEPTLYIYTGGEEVGYVVGIRNYPRFPAETPEEVDDLRRRAFRIAEDLIAWTHQRSAMVVHGQTTTWIHQDSV
jgi:hypothetical protein